MRRRDFIATGAAATALPNAAVATALPNAAAATALPITAASAEAQSWDLPTNTGGYQVTIAGAVLAIACLPPGNAGAAGSPNLAEMAPLLGLGPEQQPVVWSLAEARRPNVNTLLLRLRADDQPCQARITLAVDTAGFLHITTALRHVGDGPDITVTATNVANIQIPGPIDDVLYLSGAWSQETQIQRGHRADQPLVLQSRDGKTGFGDQPYLAVRAPGVSYLCQLLWSGNWQMRAEPTDGGVSLSAGLNNWHFHHVLRAGGVLTLPTLLFARVAGDLNAATQRLHDARRALRPNPNRVTPVQFNSWYPYQGEPNAATMLAVLPTAKALGCEAFVLDAGWYRTDDDDSDAPWEARTGDWHTSRRRFPGGLREIGAACRDLGMRFGLWFEPEVIGSLSAIRRLHPTWLHHIDGQPPRDSDRAVLNLGLPAARQHVFDRVSALGTAIGIGWLKWDFNTDLGAGGWAPGLPADLTGQDPLVAHYLGLYRLQDAIRTAFPSMILEMCASGGGRMDGGILSHGHLNWISDQPNALHKLAIHFGSHLAHPAVVCNDWLVEWPPESIVGYDVDPAVVDRRGDLAFRLRVAMLGSFGISARVDLWPTADRAVAAAHVHLYQSRLRAIIHHGDQYLLTRAPAADGSGDWAVIWYAAKDRSAGALFAFRLNGPSTRRVALPGLPQDRRYRVSPFDGTATLRTGAELADGLMVSLADSFSSALYLIEALA